MIRCANCFGDHDMRSPKFLQAMQAYNEGHNELAVRLMEECAADRDAVACYVLAGWFGDRRGNLKDKARARKWTTELERLAEQGNVEAQWELGQSYRFGDVTPVDVERANVLLERAADGGWGDAQHHLGCYLETGQYGYCVDRDAAATWYERAFEQGHPETLYLYGMREFRDGQPTEEAIRLLRAAASKGFEQAEHLLRSYLQ